MGKANSDSTDHSFGKRRVMCGNNYCDQCTVVDGIQQSISEALFNQFGGLPSQHIQEDLQMMKKKEKEDDTILS